MSMRRIGIFSGTFDPIHGGHIAFAKESYKKCHLDKVVFMPEPEPRGKNNVTDITHRIELIKRSIGDDSNLDIVLVNSKRFTTDTTLDELTTLFADTHFTFLFGSDIIKNLHWPGIERMLSMSDLSIGLRHYDNEKEIRAILENIKSQYAVKFNYTLIKTTGHDISSSRIRQGITPMDLPSEVGRYISANNLYKDHTKD